MTEKKRDVGILYRKLREYGASDYYGFHMPGHKRGLIDFGNPFQIDITEIEGFDDLHHPRKNGVLVRAQERAADLYGAQETHFLINGSTAGILSAISGCTSKEGRILLARSSHCSAYHGIALRNLETVYLYPEMIENLGINGGISPIAVEKALAEDPGIQAVFITSPTYDGICSDIQGIASICHNFHVPLIVDQAHGAHFPFSEYFPEDALSAGADVVIHSVHKTLPSLTQTALLHINGDLADREKIRYYLSVYQSSSPSYVLLASIDACIELLAQKGKELFSVYTGHLQWFREQSRDLQRLCLAGKELIGSADVSDFDCSKLLISTHKTGVTGRELAGFLSEQYHIQMEMAAPFYVMGISSVGDTGEGFIRLNQALHTLDGELREGRKSVCPLQHTALQGSYRQTALFRIGTALEMGSEPVDLKISAGKIAAVFVSLYPPGIPLLVPGERISFEIQDLLAVYQAAGLEIHGLETDGKIRVLKGEKWESCFM